MQNSQNAENPQKNIQIPLAQPKIRTIARKTILLKKKFEGPNLIGPEAHNFAMRIKDLH